ncbi:hypothetical protein [Aquisalimonas sp.]|uniref:hypothetical protein n=1 Tax=Aquisalimonas sp. TaxID=1872621 RepID=UPI0025B9A984|nr:hypothetical protein [Aquisalimonas sp.]
MVDASEQSIFGTGPLIFGELEGKLRTALERWSDCNGLSGLGEWPLDFGWRVLEQWAFNEEECRGVESPWLLENVFPADKPDAYCQTVDWTTLPEDLVLPSGQWEPLLETRAQWLNRTIAKLERHCDEKEAEYRAKGYQYYHSDKVRKTHRGHDETAYEWLYLYVFEGMSHGAIANRYNLRLSRTTVRDNINSLAAIIGLNLEPKKAGRPKMRRKS